MRTGRTPPRPSYLTSDRLADAFQLDRERAETRERYGRHMFGQSLLLARRLIEAGVPIVQVNLGRVQTWDSHGDIFRRLKEDLLPPTDRGLSALLDDLNARGLLDETLVVMVGEFGRTPRLGLSGGATIAGRDHWPGVFSAVFAGGGVRGGQVVGKSDPIGAYPAPTPPPMSPPPCTTPWRSTRRPKYATVSTVLCTSSQANPSKRSIAVSKPNDPHPVPRRAVPDLNQAGCRRERSRLRSK